ncbi:MAG: M15 family metallopeptidase [Faecousia sp.]
MKKRSLLAALLLCLTLLGGCFFGETEMPPAAEYSDWNLILVDAEHSVPSDWEVTLVDLRGGEQVDQRIIDPLQQMFDACRADGLLPIVYSGYRSQETQQSIYDRNLAGNLADGYSSEEAEALTLQWVALPGTSEHQLGLAVDIDSEDTDQCSDEAVWTWLLEHCAEYGFILRYPADKTEITGINYEPWHFRYVGKEAAQTIMSEGITLEEYLSGE